MEVASWLTPHSGSIQHQEQWYWFANAGMLMACAAVIAVCVTRTHARRPWDGLLVALAPAFALTATINWDLLAVALLCAGLLAFHRGRDVAAGAALGLGAAAKVFPGLVVPALALARHREGRRWLPVTIGATVAFVLVNLPFALMNARGWAFPWLFQGTRRPNVETSWFNIMRHLSAHVATQAFWQDPYNRLSSLLAGALFVVGAALYLRASARHARVRPYADSFAVVLIYLLSAKIYSPQYALWLLPFFVLVEVPWYGFLVFAVTDAAVWFAVSWFFLSLPRFHGTGMPAHLTTTEIAVWVRYAGLALLLWLSARAPENVEAEREPLVSAQVQPAVALSS
jgi:uncharacterized membrane protein